MSEPVRPGDCSITDVLPLEIRLQIYEYVLFESGSFFSLDGEEGNSVPTLFPKLRAPPRRRSVFRGRQDPQTPGSGRRSNEGNIMSLLLTNRQMYATFCPSSLFFCLSLPISLFPIRRTYISSSSSSSSSKEHTNDV